MLRRARGSSRRISCSSVDANRSVCIRGTIALSRTFATERAAAPASRGEAETTRGLGHEYALTDLMLPGSRNARDVCWCEDSESTYVARSPHGLRNRNAHAWGKTS